MTATKRVLFAGAALALTAHAAATAQTMRGTLATGAAETGGMFQRDRNISVLQRQHPGYEALGIREGAFMLWPKFNATAEFNDNIFATEGDKVADTIFHLAPELDLTSNWSRHSLQAYARGVFNQYAQNSDQNTTDYSVGALGELDVLRSEQVNAGVDFSRFTEPRTSAGAEGEPFPVQYNLTSAFITGARAFNRLRLSARFDWKKFDYLNRTGNFPQDDRDRTLMIGTARADYAVSPDTALFVEVAGNDRDYRLATSPIVGGSPEFPNFVNRDSHGVQVLAGANFELAALVRGEIGVGYMKQSYKDTAFQDFSGLGARAQVEWFPTQLTTVTLTGSRTVEDSALIGSSSYVSTNAGLQVDHELLRNVILSGTAGYGNYDYRGVDRKDKFYSAGASGTYLLNRNIGLSLGYTYIKNDSKGTDSSVALANYAINKVAVTLTLQY